MYQQYPKVGSVKINDEFWTPYLKDFRNICMPYIFTRMEGRGYVKNFLAVAAGETGKRPYQHYPYHDGLLYEAMRGASDLLAAEYDVMLDSYLDRLIKIIGEAQGEDGYICCKTTFEYPDKRWGDNDGDIVAQHDLYNHGCLIEAAISHYKATGKRSFLKLAVKAANLIVATMGKAPKKNIIPGHSLPEEAFVKLYRLFRDDQALAGFMAENNVKPQEYLDIAEFWYDARGNHEGRFLCKTLPPSYSQDHITFAKQREAVGHSVRAMLCYLGATVVAQEKGRQDYFETLNILWENVVNKKLHISGGIGARHDIEGFDVDYNLPNKSYLETCAAIGLAFWNTEMNIVSFDSKYFDCFERSLYNNILDGIGADFKHFFYQNPLESDGELRRWDWNGCPCCPGMLMKILPALNSFIYSFDDNSLNVNMFIGSSYENEDFSISQQKGKIKIDSKGKVLTVRIRIPEYVENFALLQNGSSVEFTVEKGYAIIKGTFENAEIEVNYDQKIRRIFANPKVAENHGKVAVSYGPFVMCAEGIDNDGNIDYILAEDPHFELKGENIFANSADGKRVCFIPYYKWCNRINGPDDAKMAVWFKQENSRPLDVLANEIGEKLYGVY